MLFITHTTIKSVTNGLLFLFLLLIAVGYNNDLQAATKTSAATGNWSAPATWSPSGVPAPGDDVIIHGGHVVTVNGAYTCNNLDLGDATSGTTTVTVTTGNSLTINGAVRINPNNLASTFTLDAGAGTINMNGTFTSWSTSGTNSIRVSTGTFNITPAITINAATQNVTFTGAGTINFRNAFTDRYNKLVTFASCVVNFYNNYTVNTTAASWAAKGTAVFKGSASVVTPTTNLTLFNVQVDTNVTLASAAGTVVVGGNVVLSSGSVFTANKDFEIQGNWTNNGGILSGGSNTISFSGSAKTIGGTVGTTFPNLQIGVAASTASVTMSRHNRCSNFTINGVSAARTFTLSTGDSLAIGGDLTINQATSNNTNQLAVNGGICTVAGNLVFAGTSTTTSRIGRVGVTSGVFRLAGTVTWMSNTVIATEVITVSTGSIVFDSPVTMGSASGTMSVTGAGSIYFNGTSATSFTFGGATAPSFSTASASNVYFAKGFTNNTNALTFHAASNTYLSGNGTITPTAAITFGHLLTTASAVDTIATGAAVIVAGNTTLASGSELVLNQNLQLNGSWTNNGGTLNGGSNTVVLNGATKTIGGTSATAFPNLQLGAAASNGTYTVNSSISCNNLTFHSASNLRTLTISVGNTVAIAGNLTINQGTSAVTNTLAVNAGTCTVAGNLIFSGTNNGSYITRVVVTTGAFSVAGTVTWASNTAVNTEVISATTGTLTFGSPLTMGSGSGTLTVSGAGNIYFNGNTSTSFAFGGASTVPVFTTAAGCNLYFARGFTNNTNALTLNATSTATFTGHGTITPNAAITFGHVTISAAVNDTLASGSGAVIVKGDLTMGSGALFKANKDFEVAGNWTNNGGTFDGGTYTVIINGLTKTIGGTSATTFYNLQIGNTAVILNYTANKNITCNNLVFHGINTARTLTLSTGITLTINGNLTMNQPTGAVVNTLAVGAGTCTVAGNLVFAGTSNTATRIARVQVTSGSFTLNGSITWMSNTSSATEVITTATGTVTLANSVTMGSGSGTISVTGAGIINFNGSSAPCLAFGGATAPVLASAYGSTINFNSGLTATTTALTFAVGSTQVFRGTATLTTTSAVTFGNFQITSGNTITMAGNMSVKGNWNNNGTFVPSTYGVTFNGGTIQTVIHSGGETFYNLTVSPFGGVIQILNDVLVTNSLNLNGANIDLNGYTLTLGNSAGAALVYSAGQMYGGSFKRWFPASAITSTTGNKYGLFPIGTSLEYRPITINSTVSPTTAGYVTATHTNVAGATVVTYTDNEGANIEQIANMHSDISTSGLAGGTYNIDVRFTDMGSVGSVSNLKLLTYTGSTMGSYGTHTTTTGPVEQPVGHRTGLTVSNLNNEWVIGTNDRNATPMYRYVYSRKTGNWNDVTVGNSTWSYTPGGSGASCNCLPTSSGYATIETGHTVTVSFSDSVKFLDIDTGGALVVPVARTLNVTSSLEAFGTGTFTVNGTLNVGNELKLSSATSPTVNNNVNVYGYFTLPAGANYTQSGGTLTVDGDMTLSGALSIASGADFDFNGAGARLYGTGTFTTASGGSFPLNNNKLIMPGAAITIGTAGTNTTVALGTGSIVNNLGSVTVYGNVTGTGTSVWINNANSVLKSSGAILSTGILDASISPNTVEYTGSGAQTIKVPLTTYYELKATNAGTKTMGGDIIVDGVLTLGGSVLLNESTNILSGDGGLTMSGTSELRLSRSTDVSVYPELDGAYNLTGGTVTITQTADSCVVHAGQYYNLKLNGSAPYDLTGVNNIANNLDIQSTAYLNDNTTLTVGGTFTYSSTGTTTLHDSIAVNGLVISAGTINDGEGTINVFGTGGFTRSSSATFNATTGNVYFTGSGAQTLGGTATSHTFNNLYISKTSGTVTIGGSATSMTLAANLTLNSGTLDKGTAATITMAGGSWIINSGSFTPGTGTVVFSGASDQAIKGTSASASFNNLTVNNPGFTLTAEESVTTLNISGNLTLTDGELDAGTATTINVTGGNWTSNAGIFTPAGSNVIFSGTGAQAINGTATSQNFYSLTTNKSAGTLSVAGSTDTLTIDGNHSILAGTFNVGTADIINLHGNWSMTGGTFTNTGSTVVLNGSGIQLISSTGAFNSLEMNNPTGYASLGTNITVNGTLALNNGLIHTNAYTVIIPATATVTGASAVSYINGNEQMFVPNSAAPTETFAIGDGSGYAPVTIAFTGTTTGSGSVTAYTTGGDDADIANSGISSDKSVNRAWTLANSGVSGFTSYDATYYYPALEIDGGANTSYFFVKRYSGGVWNNTTTGTRAGTSTQATGETVFGKVIVGEKETLTIDVQPADTTVCTGTVVLLVANSSSLPVPAVKWQRDPNTGTFADITGGMDGSVYTGYTSDTLRIANPAGLGAYRYRAIYSNVNGSVTSDTADLTVNTAPTVTASLGDTICDLGTASLSATASAGVLNWYETASDTDIINTGTTYTTPVISSTFTYYVGALAGGCPSASRTAVTALVTEVPTVAGTTPGSVCDAGTVNLAAIASAGTISWFAASSGGSALATGGSYTTPSISTTTNYYVDATLNGCTTGTRTAVAAIVSTTPTATIAYQSCGGVDGNTTIQIGHTGGTAPYTYKLNSGSFTATDTVHIANESNQNYYVRDTYGCTSSATNYTATTIDPARIANVGSSSTCSCASHGEGREVYLTNSSGDLIAIVNDMGHDLGDITATVYTRSNPVVLTNNQGGTDAALSRSFVLDFAGTNLSPAVEVKFPFTNAEFTELVSASLATPAGGDDVALVSDLGSTQYEGPTEDDTYNTSDATLLLHHTQLGSGTMLGGKYVTIGLTANGEHWIHGNGNNSPLPVKLVSFEATAKAATQQVETKWVTSLEIDNDYFTIERSADGVNFSEAGRVDGAGNNTTTLTYSFTDTKPLGGISYYRLKQTDFDGKFTYSHVVAVNLNGQAAISMYPNPTDNQVFIAVSNPGKEVNLSIFDLNGRQLYSQHFEGETFKQQQTLSLQVKDLLAAGIYMVTVTSNGTEMKQKLVVN